MPYEYTENKLVQQNALALLKELGWKTANGYQGETYGLDGTFGRLSERDVVLLRYFRAAMHRLNPWLDDRQMQEVEDKLRAHLSTASLIQTNEEKYLLLRDGINVTARDESGTVYTRKALVFDFQNPDNNDFLAIEEFWVQGDYYRRRADIVGFVNGLPLLFVELKHPDVEVKVAYDGNYTDYQDTIPQLFFYNAMVMLSNGSQSKVGTLGSKFEFFHEWKRLKEEDAGSVELETMLKGMCNRANFLDLFENFILYDHFGGRTSKILARNHQYLGVNEAVKAYQERKLRQGKLGVFWHTQGSGKSYSMVFLAQKICRKVKGSPTIVVLTDREELNKQISTTFECCGMLSGAKASSCIARSGEDLLSKLRGNPRFIFTLIQKFNQDSPEPIIPDHDILILSDEAHRSQNGIFAENMVKLLPTASRLGFTGTPLFLDNNITERTFGGYLSVYDFNRAVDDGATVPLYYENRGEKLKNIENPELTDKILKAIENADLSDEQEEKLEKEFQKEIHLLTAEPRLRAIAEDFVKHYSDHWETGKAMFVCLNKVTCVRMYNFVQEYWTEAISSLEKEISSGTVSQQQALELQRKLDWMKQTEMAVVISQEQNEIKTFQTWGLDILPHREKMVKRELDKEFKDPENPFRIVFVCAMWLTGFDVKCLSSIYFDKPLKAHTLMQAIARANRVSEGKTNGLIVDYIGIVKALRLALADYTANVGRVSGGKTPTIDKKALVEQFMQAISEVEELLVRAECPLLELLAATGFQQIAVLAEMADRVCASVELRKQFNSRASFILKAARYLNREEFTQASLEKHDAIHAIYNRINRSRPHPDNTPLMVELNRILNEYVEVESAQKSVEFDISKIDFNRIKDLFAKVKQKNLALKDLSELIEAALKTMVEANKTRADFLKRYQEIISAYNKEQDKTEIEAVFQKLLELTKQLSEEKERYVREGFSSEEELAIYDLLKQDSLTKDEIKQIKSLAKELLAKVKAKIAEFDHWTDKPETRAAVDILIRDTLWAELPPSYDERLEKCRNDLFEHMRTHYWHLPMSTVPAAQSAGMYV
ncbi:MAG TPA: type I restriction endonuclease subunit R [Sutterella sp.]|nr:type I restriction endonuclease subunit R [Sutterella sp.]